MMKRCLDIVLAGLGLLLVLPLFPLIGLLIKLDSRGIDLVSHIPHPFSGAQRVFLGMPLNPT
jgi:lipopolysaccharide/colanic/teichoic acid biosynthesis glycosyltransferase